MWVSDESLLLMIITFLFWNAAFVSFTLVKRSCGEQWKRGGKEDVVIVLKETTMRMIREKGEEPPV